MNARRLIEALFKTGAAFFDTGNRGFLSASGSVYLGMDTGRIADAVLKFVDVWSRGKPRREEIRKDPAGAIQFLVDNYGLAAVFVTPHKVVVLSKDGAPLKLSKEHIQWLEDRMMIGPDEDVLVVDALNRAEKHNMPAAVAIYGEDEKKLSKRPTRAAKMRKWRMRGPEDEEFARQVAAREKSLPKFSGVEAPELPTTSKPTKVPVHVMRFIKGGGANVHPQAKMYGVESKGE